MDVVGRFSFNGDTPSRVFMALAAALTCAGAASAADREHPAVVELYQSQGCSSCPPANANLIALSDRPDLLTLSFQVTYWDQLGWVDTFGAEAFNQRQWDYARAFHREQVATPQVVVNGRADVVGARHGEIEALVSRADRGDGGPAISTHGAEVTVSNASAAQGAIVYLVRYDPKTIMVPIRRGENGGKTLPHRNVVRELVRLGSLSRMTQVFALPPARSDGLGQAILVQSGPGGPILAASRI